jgi:hypothetical protein
MRLSNLRLQIAFNGLSLSLFSLLFFVAAPNAQQPAGGGARGHGRSKIAAYQVPFPYMDKTVKFHVLLLGRQNFIHMGSSAATLPSGFAGKLSKPQFIAQIAYGYRRGGIVRIYETPVVPNTTAKSFLDAVLEGKIFRDRSGPDYKMTVITKKGIFIGIGSTDHPAYEESLKEFGAIR